MKRSALALLLLVAACSSRAGSNGAGPDGSVPAGGDGGDMSDAPESPDGAKSDGGGGADAGDGGGLARACTAETVVPCACASGIGAQRCAADGSGWDACACASYGAQLAVSPEGNDSAAGTLAAPFKTLERAQTAVRALLSAGSPPAGGIVVWLRAGLYPRTATFSLTSQDSGQAGAPVVYRGYPGESAVLVGGTQLPAPSFQTVTSSSPVWGRLDPTARGTVVSVSMPSLGITDYGTLRPRGAFVTGIPAALELFIDGQRAPLGRWPDQGETDAEGVRPSSTAAQVTVYGAGVVPDVTGTYVQDSVQDGVSSFTRQGTVGGLTYHLYRLTQATSTGWFITTSASGYPSGSDPFFFVYQPVLAPMAGANTGKGTPMFTAPTAAIDGYSQIATVPDAQSFTLATNRTGRWTQAPDAWVHGYFAYPWADNHLPVASLDTTTGGITVTGAPIGGINPVVQGGGPSPVYAYNLLEEITQPGEWYLDRTTGTLYLWPPSNLAQHDLEVSVLSTPLVTATGASHVILQEVTMEATRSQLVTIQGGSTDVEVVGCTLRDAGEVAAEIVDGTGNLFDGDVVYGAGEDGIDLGGGDRATLTAGGNTVQNSDLHDYAEWVWTYTPAVRLSGDGNVVQHNVMHDSPHDAILFYGSSQHTIAYNDIYRVLTFASDSGAIYTYADWGSYGNVIQYNFIHDIATQLDGFGVHGIYLDGCSSGPTVTGNVLYNITAPAIFHNGGHDVTMTNNVVAGSGAALLTTAYCANNVGTSCAADAGVDLVAELQALDYEEDPWATTYPSCAAIPDDCATVTTPGSHWLTPYGTTFADNVSYENVLFYQDDNATTLTYYVDFGNNLNGVNPLFVDAGGEDFALDPSSPAFGLPGFQAIPFASIGIQK